MKEQTLSDDIHETDYPNPIEYIKTEDVKDFIKKLKEEIGCEDELHSDDVFKWIDKLAGDKLI